MATAIDCLEVLYDIDNRPKNGELSNRSKSGLRLSTINLKLVGGVVKKEPRTTYKEPRNTLRKKNALPYFRVIGSVFAWCSCPIHGSNMQ